MKAHHSVLFIAFVYWYAENQHFGWHAFPKSAPEAICDGIVFLLLAIAVLVETIEGKSKS